MAFSTIADRQGSSYDALTVIRPITSAAISATTSETGIAIPVASFEDIYAVLQVRAISAFVAGTATWSFAVEVSTTLGGTYTPVGSITLTSGAANDYLIPLSGYTVQKLVPNAGFVRVTATKTGTPGNLTYSAYLSPDVE
jgi:hypothetical protein